MRYPEDKNTSSELLRLALPQIARHGSGFQPPSYAIWYEYVSGCNAPLKQALDARTAKGGALSSDETNAFYATYVAARDAKALDRLSGQLQKTVDEFGQLAGSASRQTQDYGRSLATYGERLAPDLNLDALRGVIGALAAETQRMQASNRELNERLQANQREFASLKAQMATVQNEALLDPLTRLSNRRGFQRRIDEMLAAGADGLAGSSLLMADIDHFKQINDTHGHLLGDRVLQTVAEVIRGSVKGRDVAARFGGEEFAILLPETPLRGALVLAEQIRQTVARGRIRRIDRDETIGGVTISLGVANYRPGETLEQWLERADRALYQSKQRGRNCVTAAAAGLATA
jgi:diguanylate cyclase